MMYSFHECNLMMDRRKNKIRRVWCSVAVSLSNKLKLSSLAVDV